MPTRRHSSIPVLILVIGFVLLSSGVRAPFGQIGPLAPAVPWDHSLVTLLGLIPPLMMGLAAPLGTPLRARLGDERALLVAAVLEAIGAVLRPLGITGLVAGTVLASGAIGIMNVLLPVLVRRRFQGGGAGMAMAAYALAMGGGSALVAASAIPVLEATGSWNIAVLMAAAPIVLGLLAWIPQWWHDEPESQRPASTTPHLPHQPSRTALAWSLLSFFGIQSLMFYVAMAWLPTLETSRGLSPHSAAVSLQALIWAVAVGGAVAAAIAGRTATQRAVVLTTVMVSALGWLGVALLPMTWSLPSSIVLGLGLGAGQAVPGVLYAKRGHDPRHTASLSAFAQFGGFLLAAVGPVIAPLLSGLASRPAQGWTWVALGLAALALVNGVLSYRGSTDRPAAKTPLKSATS